MLVWDAIQITWCLVCPSVTEVISLSPELSVGEQLSCSDLPVRDWEGRHHGSRPAAQPALSHGSVACAVCGVWTL